MNAGDDKQKNCGACSWNTDGLMVWCAGCGHAIAAARNLAAREGTLSPVPDVEQQKRNLQLISLAPELARSLAAVLDAFRTAVGPEVWPEFEGSSRHFPDAHNAAVVTAQTLLEQVPR